MSVFTDEEIEYLTSQGLGRIATVGPDGQPHVVPVTYTFNADEDALDIGGMNWGATKKWRDAQQNPRVTFLVDDVIPKPRAARAVEVRGIAELHEDGGDRINPRFPGFAPQFFRLRPHHIVSWGLRKAEDGRDFAPDSRDVGGDAPT